LVEYSSFDCPHCQEFHETVVPTLIERVRAGDISFTYVPVWGTGGVSNGEGAAKAAVCASEQDAFWPFHDALFNWQIVYGNTAFAQNRLASGIESLGLDRAAWETCLRSDLPDRIVMSRDEAVEDVEGFSGTPMILVNGAPTGLDLAGINTAIDQALSFSPPPAEPESTQEAEATAEATEAS
jgi:protein-disulfide isomerase